MEIPVLFRTEMMDRPKKLTLLLLAAYRLPDDELDTLVFKTLITAGESAQRPVDEKTSRIIYLFLKKSLRNPEDLLK